MMAKRFLGVAFLAAAAAWAQNGPQFTISAVAGNSQKGYSGDGGPATSAEMSGPFGVALDASGDIYISDQGNNRIRKVTPAGTISTYAGNGKTTPVNGPALDSGMQPAGLVLDSSGNLYIADKSGSIEKVDTSGSLTIVAGQPGFGGYAGDGGPAVDAKLCQPSGMAFDSAGNLYVADNCNDAIRKIDTQGIITTVAGQPQVHGYSGDGGPATSAKLSFPDDVAFDSAGNLYVADMGNQVIRKINTSGNISTIAGQADKAGYSGDGGPALSAQFNNPGDVALDASGNLYISDSLNAVVRVVLTNGTIYTIAGNGSENYSGNSGPATSVSVSEPWQIVALASGNLYVADRYNNIVWLLTPAALSPAITSVDGSGLSVPLVTTISPNGLFSVFGSGFASAGTALEPGAVSGALVTNAAHTCVQVGNLMAPLTYVSPAQINAQVPAVSTGGAVDVSVISNCGLSNQSSSTPVLASVAPAAPEFLYYVHNTNGQNPVAAVDNATGAYIAAAGLIAGATFTPAQAGEIVTVFGVGFGQTSPPQTPGTLATAAAQVPNATVSLGGNPITTLYVGVSPTYAGLYQVTFAVPSGLEAGPQSIQVSIGGVTSPAGAFLEVGK